MRKFRGFKLGRKLVRIFKWVIKPRRRPTGGYRRLSGSSYGCRAKTMAKICHWGRCLKLRARSLCPSRSCTATAAAAAPDAYTRIDSGLFEEQKPVQVPKGHLAVYVGQNHDDPHRFLVPVFYFNHPLFGDLLREAEKEFGYQHPGGITIPCPVQEFENVQTRIAAGNKVSWKRR